MEQLSLLDPLPLAPQRQRRRLLTKQEQAILDLERPDVQERIQTIVPLLNAAVEPSDVLKLYRGSTLHFWVACTYLKPEVFGRVVDILVRVRGEGVLKAKMY